MDSRARAAVAPAYLFACLVLGGSAQGIWQIMLLQLSGLAIIGWAAWGRDDAPVAAPARQLLWFTALAIFVVLLQLLPLPPGIWTHLGPRAEIAKDFSALGMPVPAEPLSVAPAAGLTALLGIIPPLALFCAMVRLKAYRPRWIAVALIAGTVAGIALGTLQAASSSAVRSPWYIYDQTNLGRAVGFFANANHMGTLLVITIPFLAAVIASAKSRSMQRYSAVVAVSAGSGIVVLVGLALNGSLAGYGLTLPALAASALIILPPASRLRLWVVGLAVLLVVGAITALETTPIGASKIGERSTTSVQSRGDILATTTRAIGDFMPFGSGLGSFQSVYPLYERPEQVTVTFVVHAHNDYAEVILELGVAGIILILLFLAWWGAAVWRVWRTAEASPFARAAAIASAAILIHSLVDFPLRTEAIASVLGMCLALLADSRAAPPKEKTALRRGRHREIR